MRKITIIAPMMIAAFVAIGLAPASASTDSTSSTVGLADCTYKVTRTVKVYELPTASSPHLRTKHKKDRVRGFSNLTYYNESEHVRYRAVDTKKAQDDIGWMDTSALKLIRCDR